MVIGAASDAPAPVEEIVSADAATTDVSVVGKAWFAVAGVGPTLAPGIGVGCAALATTDSSSVGKSGVALADGCGVAAGPTAVTAAGDAAGLAPNFARAACCACSCSCKVFTVSVSVCTCCRNDSISLGDGEGLGP